MTTPQPDAMTDPQRIITALRQQLEEQRAERDAALVEKAVLAKELAARTAELGQRTTEYGERINHQTATIDVLQAMSASPADPRPVFALIARHANELCNGTGCAIHEFDGNLVHLRTSQHGSAIQSAVAEYLKLFPMAPTRGSFTCRAILDKQMVHITDTEVDGAAHPAVRALGYRSQLSIPLMRDGAAIGAISLGGALGGFSDSQISLLRTFAEQAVIAITSAETYRALQGRTSDLQEALGYQTATSDVLKVISRSTFDLQPVLDTVAETAARLCDADQAAIARAERGEMWLVANFGFPPEYEADRRSRGRMPIDPTLPIVAYRAVLEKRLVHVPDVATVPGYSETAITLGKQRTSLGVPLMREGEVIGVIILARQRVEPFTDRQIEVVSTFADQAVIAIENARLMAETREALEQQTATAEVLQVINANPGNLAPVFDTILEKAHALCGSIWGTLSRFQDGRIQALATRGLSARFDALVRQPLPPSHRHQALIDGQRLVHVLDVQAESEEWRPVVAEQRRTQPRRTALWIPLRKDGTLLGFISAFRAEVRAFSDKEIALLENFAAQAVIAMENARLITETREALEQQTATTEVLQVINASPGNLAPVFDAILEKAHSLCGAAVGSLMVFDGAHFHMVATQGIPQQHASLASRPFPPTTLSLPLIEGERFNHVLDVRTLDIRADDDLTRDLATSTEVRTALVVPLRNDSTLLGYISAFRLEVRPFSEKEIALLENFAAQAVIAIENTRLITEQREALEQQTATAEVLGVINSSPGNLAPVFDAILDKAHALCGATVGNLVIYKDGHFHTLATHGFPEQIVALMQHPLPPNPNTQALIDGSRFRQVEDIRAIEIDPDYLILRAMVQYTDVRTILLIPLRKDGVLLGFISANRPKVRLFSEKEIALLENFAAQAVIAMENARLLDQIRQREDELRITFENMGDGVALFDEMPRLVAWNRRFQEIFNLPVDLLEQHRTYEEHLRFLAARGDFGSGLDADEQLRTLVATTDKPSIYERTRPDGRVLEIRRNPVPSGGFVLIFSDITERKRSEEEIRAARDAAEEASRTIEAAYRDLKTAQANLIQAEKMASLGQLTAGIAHEIKNPLNFVNNFAALSVDLLGELKETAAPGFAGLSEKQRAEVEDVSAMLTSNLEKITEHGKRADGIVKAMLEHSRGSSGERRMVDLNALVDDALNLAYHGARAQDQTFNITLDRDFGAGIAPIEVNPQDLTRVFLNIFSNGFYATTKRTRDSGDAGFVPTLKVTTIDAGEAVEIRVRDNGTGIPADIRDKMFQPFFTTKPTGEGTGLGLSITYDIITQQHGGSITVDSKVGNYSEFTIRLPRNP